MKGIFITLEGTEGAGKTVQSKKLCAWLEDKGYEVVHTMEPGSTKIGKSIREILLDPKNKSLTDISELFLYLADRNQHVIDVIIPNLKKGKVVVCDRYIDATLAYQGYGRGLPIGFVKKLNKFATNSLKPDLTLIFDIPLSLGLKRARKVSGNGGDRMEKEKNTFHRRVRAGYFSIAKREPKRVKIIKVKGSIAQVQKRVQNTVKRLFS